MYSVSSPTIFRYVTWHELHEFDLCHPSIERLYWRSNIVLCSALPHLVISSKTSHKEGIVSYSVIVFIGRFSHYYNTIMMSGDPYITDL